MTIGLDKNGDGLTGCFDNSPRVRGVMAAMVKAMRAKSVTGLFSIRNVNQLGPAMLRKTAELVGIDGSVPDDDLKDAIIERRKAAQNNAGTALLLQFQSFDLPAGDERAWFGNPVATNSYSTTVGQMVNGAILMVSTNSIVRASSRMAGVGAVSIINPSCNVMYGVFAWLSGDQGNIDALSWRITDHDIRTASPDTALGLGSGVYSVSRWPPGYYVADDSFRFRNGTLPVYFANRGRAVFCGIDYRKTYLQAGEAGVGFSDGEGGD